MAGFNQAYSAVLGALQRAFGGKPEQLAGSLGAMCALRDMAQALMRMPIGQGPGTAGPSFEYVAPEHRSEGIARAGISVRPHGPYIVKGAVTLLHKRTIRSERSEALTWTTEGELETGATYALCRCGASARKPFCDGSHARVGFDGTETADPGPVADRQTIREVPPLRIKEDHSLCSKAGFCVNRFGRLAQLGDDAEDVRVRSQVIAIIEHCPSGALSCEIRTQDGAGAEALIPVEPDLPREIAVTARGPLWVTGGIPIERADGRPVDVRNRVVLCRCGQSKNKPFCDGSHIDIGFQG